MTHKGTTGLRKVLGFRDLLLFYLVMVAAIRTAAMSTAMGASILLFWGLGFLTFMLPLGAAVAELTDRYPEEGGIYIWTQKALGPFHGYLAAWFYWCSNLVYFPAALFFVASNSAYLLPGAAELADNSLYLGLVSGCLLLLVYGLNFVGLDLARYLHNLGAVGGFWIPALVIILLGLGSWWTFGSATDFSWPQLVPQFDSLGDLTLLSVLVYSFAGFEGASVMGEEIQHPRRNLPRALFWAGGSMTALYLLISFSILLIMPAEQLTGLRGLADSLSQAATTLIGPFWGALTASVILGGIILSGVGGVSSWLAAASRLPFVVGIDRYLPPAFARLHPRFHTPYVGLTVITGLTLGFILLGSLGEQAEQAYEIFVSLEITVFFIPYLYLFVALIKLRRQRAPVSSAGFRIPGGRTGVVAVGGIGLTTVLLTLILACLPDDSVADPGYFYQTVIGGFGALALTGVGLYVWGQRRATAADR